MYAIYTVYVCVEIAYFVILFMFSIIVLIISIYYDNLNEIITIFG